MFAALGVLFLVGGAITRYAISDRVDQANLDVIGLILMGGGVLSLVIAAIQGAGWMSMGRRRATTERVVSADGSHMVEETRVS